MTRFYESTSPTRRRTVPRLEGMFDLRSTLKRSGLSVFFSPIVLNLIWEGTRSNCSAR